jgi:hypothetical protein
MIVDCDVGEHIEAEEGEGGKDFVVDFTDGQEDGEEEEAG